MVAIEGDHLLEEALRSGMVLKTVFVSERRAVPKMVPRGVEVLRLTEEVFESVVETRSPQGVAALMVPPVFEMEDVMGLATPLILVAVGLQDPGNLGTLVRSAEAFGATRGVDYSGDGECVEPEGAAGERGECVSGACGVGDAARWQG